MQENTVEIISISDGESCVPDVKAAAAHLKTHMKQRLQAVRKQESLNNDSKLTIITLSSDITAPPLDNSIVRNPLTNNCLQSSSTKVQAWLNENYDSMIRYVEINQMQYITGAKSTKRILIRRDYKKPGTNSISEQNSPPIGDAVAVPSQQLKTLEMLSENEMQQKIELYRYLHLIDKNDRVKAKVASTERRKSSRVKNLGLIKEKRALTCREVGVNVPAIRNRMGVRELSDSSNSKDWRLNSTSLSAKTTSSTPKRTTNHTNEVAAEKQKSLNAKFLQVPEITSTSIPSNNIRLRSRTSLNLNKHASTTSEKTLANESYKSKKSAKKINKCDKLRKTKNSKKNRNTKIKDQFKKLVNTRNANAARLISKNKPVLKRHKILTRSKSEQKMKHFKSRPRFKLLKVVRRRSTRLRSSGKLKNINLQAVLFISKSRQIIKKKVENETKKGKSSTSETFVRTIMIQPGHKNKVDTDCKLFEPDFLFDGLTPEHSIALRERKQYLDDAMQASDVEEENIISKGFTDAEVRMSLSSFEKIKTVVNFKNDYLLIGPQNNDQYTTEDLEVSQLTEKLIEKEAEDDFIPSYKRIGNNKHSSGGLQCTSSYPPSTISGLNVINYERGTNTDVTSHVEEPPSLATGHELLTSSISRNSDNNETLNGSQAECLSTSIVCTDKKVSQSHIVCVSEDKGKIIGAYYLDFNLVLVQKLLVSFWCQTPLGNVLGTQDMWIPKGNTERLIMKNGSSRIKSSEMIISLHDSVAYIELWIKEHKSDKRERPLADIFVVIYLTSMQNGCSKRVIQLENIQGFASDVQYIVLRNSQNIIVSWNIMNDNVSSTVVHCYELTADYQLVNNIKIMQSVNHYLSSLLNIEDCYHIFMGSGDQKISFWNIENLDSSYVIATIDLVNVPLLRTVWAKCDRGFLFTLHELNNGLLQLIAINSNQSTWKRLRTYKAESESNRVKSAFIANGCVIASYHNSIVSWNAETNDIICESAFDDKLFLTFRSHIVVVLKNEVHVRHALEYMMSLEEV